MSTSFKQDFRKRYISNEAKGRMYGHLAIWFVRRKHIQVVIIGFEGTGS